MSGFERLTHRKLPLISVVLVALVGGAYLILSGGDEPASGEQGEVVLPAGSGRAAVVEAAQRLPERGGTIVVGRARLDVNEPDAPLGDAAEALVAVSRTRTPAALELSQGAGTQPVRATTDRPEQAPVLAQELLARLAPRGFWLFGIGGLHVDSSQDRNSLVSIGRTVEPHQRALTAVLAAASTLTEAEPTVSVARGGVELRVRANTAAEAGRTWRTTARTVRLEGEARKDVRVYVDIPAADAYRPVLSGRVGDSPTRALALLRALGDGAYVTTDRSYARAQVARSRAARAVAETAGAAAVERVEVFWRVADAETRWFDAAGIDRTATSLDDVPATVLRLLPGVERARKAGLSPLHWDRQAVDGVARLKLSRPEWYDDEGTQLDRLVRVIRRVGWPGLARFSVVLGPGTCEGSDAVAVAEVTSTSDGKARKVRPAAGCIDEAGLTAMRRAWNATAR